MSKVYTVLQADTNAARAAIKAAGCTHAVINVHWREAQPTATGSIDATRLAQLQSDINNAISNGLKVILSLNLQYAPTWVLSGVEQFKDQFGNSYNDTNYGNGKAVRNWIWTQSGRTYVADFISRIGAGLTTAQKAAIDGSRLGGGWYGELHYPQDIVTLGNPTPANMWQGYGASMQTGTDLATGLTVCPLPGYIPYGTGATDVNNATWINWYLNGLTENWANWLIAQYKAAGFTRNLYMMLPGYGVRTNQSPLIGGSQNSAYQLAAKLGEDHIRAIGNIMYDSAVQPYSTWLNTVDGFAGGTADSDKSAWKSIYEKSLIRNKHYLLLGENTGSESNTGMNNIFSGALGSASYAGYPGTPATGSYFQGCVWLGYGDLLAGGAKATMANYATLIAANP